MDSYKFSKRKFVFPKTLKVYFCSYLGCLVMKENLKYLIFFIVLKIKVYFSCGYGGVVVSASVSSAVHHCSCKGGFKICVLADFHLSRFYKKSTTLSCKVN